jgi:hypothetical protein
VRPRRTENSTTVYRLPGGNEDNDLWTYHTEDDQGQIVTCSVWEPTPEEREAIANGENIRLIIWGKTILPVAIDTTDEALGKPPNG